jgi:hypothetical protein
MSHQDLVKKATPKEQIILDLEKKYMDILLGIFKSPAFMSSMHSLEKSIQKFSNQPNKLWGTQAINAPFERMVHFHVYKKLGAKIIEPFPYPDSSDVAIVLNDCVLNIDAKTDSATSNGGDLNQLQSELNQINFQAKKINGDWDFIPNLEISYNNKPILTFFIACYFEAEKETFKNFRLLKDFINPKNEKIYKTFHLTCIPNGDLSHLWGDQKFIKGAKTYNPFKEKQKKGEQDKLTAYLLGQGILAKDIPKTKEGIFKKITLSTAEFKNYKDILSDYKKIKTDPAELKKRQLKARNFLTQINNKFKTMSLFLHVTESEQKGKCFYYPQCLRTKIVFKVKAVNKKEQFLPYSPIYEGSFRISWEIFHDRFDSKLDRWDGDKSWNIE